MTDETATEDAARESGAKQGPTNADIEAQILDLALRMDEDAFYNSARKDGFQLSIDKENDSVRVTSVYGHDFTLKTGLADFQRRLDEPSVEQKEKAEQQKQAEAQQQQKQQAAAQQQHAAAAPRSTKDTAASTAAGVVYALSSLPWRFVKSTASLFEDGTPGLSEASRARRLSARVGESRERIREIEQEVDSDLRFLRDPQRSKATAELFESFEQAQDAEGRAKVRETFQEQLGDGQISPKAQERVNRLFQNADEYTDLTHKIAESAWKNGEDPEAVVKETEKRKQFAESLDAGPVTNKQGEGLSGKFRAMSETVKTFIANLVKRITGREDDQAQAGPAPS